MGVQMIYVWLGLLLFSAPTLVFSARPQSSFGWRSGRLILATILGYGLVLLALYTNQIYADLITEQFFLQFPECADQRCDHAPDLHIDGPALAMLTYLGWVIAALHVGGWEFLWRVSYRKSIKDMGNAFKGKWLSNVYAGFAIFGFIIYPICMLVSYLALVIFADAPL